MCVSSVYNIKNTNMEDMKVFLLGKLQKNHSNTDIINIIIIIVY